MTRSEALTRFTLAVRDGKSGNYGKAVEIVEAVRKKHGDVAAAIARKEIWACVNSEKWDRK